jgi:hypothetical protein
MAVSAIDATVGGTSSNSYATQAEVQQYMDDRLNVTAWTGATDDQQKQAMIQGTRQLDALYSWVGTKADQDQALDWPRVAAIDCEGYLIDSDEIPQRIKDAQSEYALYLLQRDTVEPDLVVKGIKSAKVGPLAVEVDGLSIPALLNRPSMVAVGCLGTPTGLAFPGGITNGESLRV